MLAKAPLALSASLFLFAAALHPQSPQPTGGGYLLTTNVNEVSVDIGVTDAKGQPVSGLAAADFQLLEDGQERPLSSFQSIAHSLQPASAQPPANTFLNTARIDPDAPLNLIYLDFVPVESPQGALVLYQQLAQFLQSKPPGAQFALFAGVGQPRLLHGFTANGRDLIDTIRHEKHLTTAGLPITTASGAGDSQALDAERAYRILLSQRFGSHTQSESGLFQSPGQLPSNDLQQIERTESTLETKRRMCATELTGLLRLSEYLSAIPGRKNIFWITHPYEIAGFNTRGEGFDCTADLKADVALLATAHISVYGFDLRPLSVMPGADVSATSSPTSTGGISTILTRRAEDATLELVSSQAGGTASYNSAGLADAMQRATRSGANYYLATFNPHPSANPYHSIELRLRHPYPGYQLTYNRGYWTNPPAQQKPGDDIMARLAYGLRYGMPPMTALVFQAHIACASTSTSPASASPSTTPCIAAKAKDRQPDTRTLTIDFSVLPELLATLKSQPATLELHYGIAAFDQLGNSLQYKEGKISGPLTPRLIAQIQQSGVNFHPAIELPSSARYLRLVVCEQSQSACGSLALDLLHDLAQ